MLPRLRRIANSRVSWSIVLIVLFVVVATVPIVSAHAALVGSSPESGEHVAEPPDEVTLRYSAGVQLATVSVVSADGERVSKSARIDPQDHSVVHVPLEDGIENGTYLVKWKVLSADGHTVSGSFFFVVGEGRLTREQVLSIYTQDDDGGNFKSPVAPVFRALLFGGAIVLVGAPITLLFVLYPLARTHEIPTTTADRATRFLFGGALLAVFVSATALATIQLTASGSLSLGRIQQFATTASGMAWLVRIVIALVLGLLTALIATKRVSLLKREWLGALLGGGLLVQLTVSWTSHSFAVTGGLVGLLVDFGHLVGGALWMGGLVVLALLAPAFLKRAPADARITAQLLRRFSVLAIAGVALVSATGLAIAAWHVPTVDSLSATLYGTALSVKVFLVLLAVGLGGLNRFVLHRRLRVSTIGRGEWAGWSGLSMIPIFGIGDGSSQGTVRTFIRSVRLELVLLVVVLLLSGLITSIPTAANAATHDQSGTELVFEAEIDGGTLTFSMIPRHVGQNVVTINVTKNGEPVQTKVPVSITASQPAQNVTLSPVELDKIGPGSYSTVLTIPTTGMWHFRVSTWTAKAHVVETFIIHISSNSGGQMQHSHTAHTHSSGRGTGNWLPTILRFGAFAIAIAGIVAVSYEIHGMKSLRRDK